MARGGKRDGAGRPAGAATKRTREVAVAAAAEGVTPLEYMLDVLRDPKAETERRDWAAEKAAPFIHARLANINAKHDVSDALADLLKAVDGRTRGIPSGG
jgi:hypothetical protein